MIWLCLALCFSGFGALCLAVDRHREHIFGKKKPANSVLLQLLGWSLLACAIVPATSDLGPSIGLALWASALTLAAATQMLLLSYRPRLIPSLSLAVPTLAISLSLLQWSLP